MMNQLPNTVYVVISKVKEEWQVYFLAKSNQIDWFYAVWETLDDTIDNARDVLNDMYKRSKKLTFQDLYINWRIKEMLAL